jgi:hypothetical protein
MNAAGYGWFVDPTPYNDSEYGPKKLPSAATLTATRSMDLLTAVLHELGHTLGRDDLHSANTANDLMYESLTPGTRKTNLAAVDAIMAGGI